MTNTILAGLDDAALGRAVRKWRKRAVGTATELCDLTGISSGYLSDIENGRRRLNSPTAARIAEAVKLTPEDFLAEVERCATGAPTRLQEDSPAYGGRDDFEDLARLLADRIDKAELKAMLHDLAESAATGNPQAAARARALLKLMMP